MESSREDRDETPPFIDDEKTNEAESEEDARNTQLRKLVRQVTTDTSLTPKERTRKVQLLMTQQYRSSNAAVNKSSPSSSSRVVKTEASFFEEHMGCKHYMRDCWIVAPCCNEIFTCRLCHDEEKDHAIDRYLIEKVVCMHCFQEQPFGNSCKNSDCSHFEKAFADHYFCDICKFFENDPVSSVYHCHDCNMCRRGLGIGIDFKHCNTCNACVSMELFDTHVCIERSLESNCPICHEYMFTSIAPVMFMKCGHAMHSACFNSYVLTDYTCPVCKKSCFDMSSHFDQVDEYVKSIRMPAEYQDVEAEILCNDCLVRTEAPFAFIYHKCGDCGSYNTKVSVKCLPGLVGSIKLTISFLSTDP